MQSAPLAQLPKPAPVAKTPVAKTKSQALSTYFSPARVLPQFVAALLVMELLRVAVRLGMSWADHGPEAQALAAGW